MENGVVYMEDSGRVGEFGCVPVEVGGEDRGLCIIVDTEDICFVSLVGEYEGG